MDQHIKCNNLFNCIGEKDFKIKENYKKKNAKKKKIYEENNKKKLAIIILYTTHTNKHTRARNSK